MGRKSTLAASDMLAHASQRGGQPEGLAFRRESRLGIWIWKSQNFPTRGNQYSSDLAFLVSPGPPICWLPLFRPSPTQLSLEQDTGSAPTSPCAGPINTCEHPSFPLSAWGLRQAVLILGAASSAFRSLSYRTREATTLCVLCSLELPTQLQLISRVGASGS